MNLSGKYHKTEYRKEFPYSKSNRKYLKKPRRSNSSLTPSEGQYAQSYQSQSHTTTTTREKRRQKDTKSYDQPKPTTSQRPSSARKQKLAPTQSRKEELMQLLEQSQQNRTPAQQTQKPRRAQIVNEGKNSSGDGGNIVGTLFWNVIYIVVGISIFSDSPFIVFGIVAFCGFRIWSAIKSVGQ